MLVNICKVVVAMCALAWSCTAHAQCEGRWVQGFHRPGANDTVNCAKAWDPDGPGPLGQKIVFGGYFSQVGPVAASRIATYDPATGGWAPLGSGFDSGDVRAIAALPNGDLYAVGTFLSAGSVSTLRIAKWNGTAWQACGSGISGNAYAIAALPDGRVVVGGTFTTAGGSAQSNLAIWDGTSWSGVGGGVSGGDVNALAVMGDGSLVVGGTFTTAGTTALQGVARWNGSTWAAMGPQTISTVYSLCVRQSGELLAGARVVNQGTQVVRWNGSAWVSLGGPGVTARAITELRDGRLVVGGPSLVATERGRVVAFDGVAWTQLGSDITNPYVADTFVNAIVELPDGRIIAAGKLWYNDTRMLSHIAAWTGSQWTPFPTGNGASGVSNTLRKLVAQSDNSVVAIGDFAGIGSASTGRVARWNGLEWSRLGTSVMNVFVNVHDVALRPDGTVLVGGGLMPDVGNVARATSTTWVGIGPDLINSVFALAPTSNTEFVVGGSLVVDVSTRNIAKWNGSRYVPLGTGVDGIVHALQALPGGDIIAGGEFANAGGLPSPGIARWNSASSTWTSLGSGIAGTIRVIRRLPNGDIIAGGLFTSASGIPANNIARWNGSQWSALGEGLNGTVLGIALHPSGDIYVCGAFTAAGSTAARNVARWNGSEWKPLGSGLNATANSIAITPAGDIYVGGAFSVAGGVPSYCIAMYSSAGCCPADLDNDDNLSNGLIRDGAVTVDDLLCFLRAFELGDPSGDLDDDGDPSTGTPDGTIDINDLLFFLAHFEQGC